MATASSRFRLTGLFGFTEDAGIHESRDPVAASLASAPPHKVKVTPAKQARRLAPSVFDTLPKLSELRKEDSENTGNLIQLLWEATDSYEPEKSWVPKTQDLVALKKPDKRWGPAAGIAFAALAATIAFLFLRPEPAPLAIEVAAASSEVAVQNSANVVSGVERVSDLLIDPTASGDDLSNAAIALTDLNGFSRELLVLADNFGRADQMDKANLASEAGAIGISLSDRMSLTLSYRLTFNRVLKLPELPTEAETVSISEIGFSLASTISDSRDALGDLPSDPSLDGHTRAAAEAIDLVENLTIDYLQALRANDSLAALVISNEIKATATELHTDLPLFLTEIDVAVRADIASFSRALSDLDQ